MNIILSKSWRLCIKQWDWIVERIKAGDKRGVEELKKAWAKEHGFVSINSNCFFCKFVSNKDKSCNECPARKIDEEFTCMKQEYHYKRNPLAFHAEIHRLYEIFKETEK